MGFDKLFELPAKLFFLGIGQGTQRPGMTTPVNKATTVISATNFDIACIISSSNLLIFIHITKNRRV